MYVTMPMFLSTLPLDDGVRFRAWRESFMTKLILTYGTVFSVSIFAIMLPMIGNMSITGISEYGNTIFKVFMIIGGAIAIPAGQALFAKLFGSGEYTDKSRAVSMKEVYNIMKGNYNTSMGGATLSAGSNKYSDDSFNYDINDDVGGK